MFLQEKERNDKLKAEVNYLKDEINSIQANQHLDTQKMRLLMANTEKELVKETEVCKEEVLKNQKLKLEIEEEQISIKRLREQIEVLYSKLRQEKVKSNEAYQKNLFLSESLDDQKIKMDEYQKLLSKENTLKTSNIHLNQKTKELESDISVLLSQKQALEAKLEKSKKKMTEVDDIVTENKDLQKTMIQKDKVIEDLERQLERTVTEAEVKLMKTVEKMRIEYQLMARSAVSTKMRKMNDYLSDRLKQQESLESDRENITTGIQMDLEERLSNTSNELSQARHRLKSKFLMFQVTL